MKPDSAETDPGLNRERFCRACRFNLRGLKMGSCPECGEFFNVQNHRTVFTSDQLGFGGWYRGDPAKRAAKFIAAVGLTALPGGLLLLPPQFGSACCLLFFVWPMLVGYTAWLFLESLMPPAWSGIMINVFAACLACGIVAVSQLYSLGLFYPPVAMFSWWIGIPAGLIRARQCT